MTVNTAATAADTMIMLQLVMTGDTGNGKIDFREFLLLVHNYERPLPEDVEVNAMFSALDKDKNGYIDRDELKTSFAALGITLTDNDVAQMMAEADVYADRIYFQGYTPLFAANRSEICTGWVSTKHFAKQNSWAGAQSSATGPYTFGPFYRTVRNL